MGFTVKKGKLTYKTKVSRINPINEDAKETLKRKKRKRGKL